MRLVTFGVPSSPRAVLRAGVQLPDHIVDIELAIAASEAAAGRRVAPAEGELESSELLAVIRRGEDAIETARVAADHVVQAGTDRLGDAQVLHDPADVQLVAPLPRPNSLRDYLVIREHMLGSKHLDEVPEEWFQLPAHYKGNVDEIYGPDDTVPWPAYTDKLDYELEICAVIGTPGRRISTAEAGRHILGYTIYNDWSARDIQLREMTIGCGPGIGKDFATSIGPCIATPDEFDPATAQLEARVDGEVWSHGTIGAMQFSFEEIIEYTTQEATLRPGDLLGSGTIGKGCGLELDRWLTEGCVVELEAEGIGVLRNPVGRKGEGPARVLEAALAARS